MMQRNSSNSRRGWGRWLPVTLVTFLVVGLLLAAGGKGGANDANNDDDDGAPAKAQKAPKQGQGNSQSVQGGEAPLLGGGGVLPLAWAEQGKPTLPRKRFGARVGPLSLPAVPPKVAFHMPVALAPGETIVVPLIMKNDSPVATLFSLQVLPQADFTLGATMATAGALPPLQAEAEPWLVSLRVPTPESETGGSTAPQPALGGR